MSVIEAIFLGLVQGLTEFIPVSSSGHLILARAFIGLSLEGSLAFDAVLHLATALAVLVYFWKDILLLIVKPWEQRKLWGALFLGTVPAAVIGLLWGDSIEAVVRTSSVVAWALLAGSLLFIVAERMAWQYTKLSSGKGFLIGLYQSFALIPGVSRSGATISGGLLFGLSREQATRFAFLLSFPILFGVGMLKLLELSGNGFAGIGVPLLVGSVVAFFSGLAAIRWMLEYLRGHTLYVFAVYRILIAILVFWFL